MERDHKADIEVMKKLATPTPEQREIESLQAEILRVRTKLDLVASYEAKQTFRAQLYRLYDRLAQRNKALNG